MSYFVTVFQGRVMGLREDATDEDSRMVRRLADVLGEGAEVYEVEGPFPRNVQEAIDAFQAQLDARADGLEPCYRARASGDREELEIEQHPCKGSGTFAALRIVQ